MTFSYNDAICRLGNFLQCEEMSNNANENVLSWIIVLFLYCNRFSSKQYLKRHTNPFNTIFFSSGASEFSISITLGIGFGFYVFIWIEFYLPNTTFIVEHNNPKTKVPKTKILEGLKNKTNLFKRFLGWLNYGLVTQ